MQFVELNPFIFIIGLGLFLVLRFWVRRDATKWLKIHAAKADFSQYEPYLVNFPYYQALSIQGKRRFLTRMLTIKDSKYFYGAEGFEVTEEMRVTISACWAQLTFGLTNYLIDDFEEVIVYRGTFYSGLVGANVKGLTLSSGKILLSWADFKQGYTLPNDDYNLGLHEMAHMLFSKANGNDSDDYEFSEAFENWYKTSNHYIIAIAKGMPSVLRSYAGTNQAEFFSVCVEVFFENPAKMRKEMPNVYAGLCTLLNQDPLNQANDYVLVAPHIPKNTFARFTEKQRLILGLQLCYYPFLLSVVLLSVFAPAVKRTIINPGGYFIIGIIAFMLAFQVLFRFLNLRKILSPMVLSASALVSLGACIILSLNVVNYLTASGTTHLHFKVMQQYTQYGDDAKPCTTFKLQYNELNYMPGMLTLPGFYNTRAINFTVDALKGGLGFNIALSASVETYDMDTQQWRRLQPD